jgi:cob(I)alamin adenosyltransferase
MAIYTRRGDEGQTGLADGSAASKASARIEALGALDEAGAAIGLARQSLADSDVDAALLFAQQRLFNCSAILAAPSATSDVPLPGADDVAFLESEIDRLSEISGGWRGFTLASGGELPARLHLARTITRRAERRIVALATEESVPGEVLAFVNRLSDLLFSAAAAQVRTGNGHQDLWDKNAHPPSR